MSSTRRRSPKWGLLVSGVSGVEGGNWGANATVKNRMLCFVNHLKIVLLQSLPISKVHAPSCDITNEPCTSSNYEKTDKKRCYTSKLKRVMG